LFTVSAFVRQGPRPATWSLLPILIALAVIIVTDLYLRLIPNKITVPSMIYVLLLAALSGRAAFGQAVLGAAVAGAGILALAIISRGGIGGGDLKLMVVVGGALGWEAAILVFALSQIVALVVAFAVSVAQRRILRGWLPIGAIIAALAAVVLVTTPR
jgi:leader peptidase (prepilin peptidase) / N-methyltransferase